MWLIKHQDMLPFGRHIFDSSFKILIYYKHYKNVLAFICAIEENKGKSQPIIQCCPWSWSL